MFWLIRKAQCIPKQNVDVNIEREYRDKKLQADSYKSFCKIFCFAKTLSENFA